MSSQNGFSAGVVPGGLYSRNDIELLVCYMLMGVGEPMPRQDVLDILAGNGMANLFELGAAIEELLQYGTLLEPQPDVLALSEKGHTATMTLYDRLPLTLRERSVKAALQLLARRRNERQNTVSVQTDDGACTVTCAVDSTSGQAPLMTLSLRVADTAQAQMIREHFLDDPALLYRSVLAILTGDAGMRMDDRQIVIQLP